MALTSNPPRGAFLYMDAARALAAVIVVFGHTRDLLLVPYQDIGQSGFVTKSFYFASGYGHSAVIVFFVLSGFWISRSVVGRASNDGFWGSYLIDRLSRLLIVLVPALILGGVLDYIGIRLVSPNLYTGATGAVSIGVSVIQTLRPANFLTDLVFLQALLLPPFGSNGPLWSLSYEFWFYIWFPAIWLLARYRRFSPALATLVLGVFFPLLALGFVSWLCGSLLSSLVARAEHWNPRRRQWIARAIFGTGGIAFFAALAAIRLTPSAVSGWQDPAVALTFAWLLLGLCLVNPPPLPGFARIATYGAGSSFSLYATHFPIVALIAAALTSHGRLPATPVNIMIVLLIVSGAVFTGYIFSLATERRTTALRNAMRRAYRKSGLPLRTASDA